MATITHKIALTVEKKDAIAAIKEYGDKVVGVVQTVEAMERSLGGDKLLLSANNYTATVAKMGGATKELIEANGGLISQENILAGASKLTESERSRLNATITEAIAKYEALGRRAPTAMLQLADATKQVAAPTETWWSSITKLAAGYVTGMAIWSTAKRIIRELFDVLVSGIQDAMAAEVAMTKLVSAVRNSGVPLEITTKAFVGLAKQIQATTSLEDDYVLSVIALATNMGVSAGEMGRVIRAAADLSAAWGGDLQSNMELIVKGGEGLTRAFKAHGIELNKSRAEVEGLNYVLPELESHFSGNAADMLDTYAGQVTALGIAWGNLKEAMGQAAMSAGGMSWIENTTSAIRGMSVVLEEKGIVGLLKMVPVGGSVGTMLVQLGEAANAAAANLKRTGDISLDAGMGVEEMARRVNELLTPALIALTPAQTGYIDRMKAAGVSTTDMAGAIGVSEAALRKYIDSSEGLSKLKEKIGEIERGVTGIGDAWEKLGTRYDEAKLMQSTLDGIKQAETAWREYFALRESHGGTTTDAQIAQVNRWFLEEASKLKADDKLWQDHYNALSALATEKMSGIAVNWVALTDAATNHSKAGLQQIADKAQATYQQALTHVGEWEAGTIEKFRLTALAAQEAADNWGSAFNGALDKIDEHLKTTATIIQGFGFPTVGAGPFGVYTPPGGTEITVPTGMPLPPMMPILPALASSGTQQTNIYITQPLGTPDAIARAVGSALTDRSRNLGLRAPTGA